MLSRLHSAQRTVTLTRLLEEPAVPLPALLGFLREASLASRVSPQGIFRLWKKLLLSSQCQWPSRQTRVFSAFTNLVFSQEHAAPSLTMACWLLAMVPSMVLTTGRSRT